MKEKILAAIGTVEKDTAYFKPAAQVKEKVLQNALNKYAKDCAPEDVVALMDTTLLHSGKDGYLLSTTHFYDNYENLQLPLAKLQRVEITGKKKNYLLLTCADGTTVEIFGTVYTDYLYRALNAVIAAVQGHAPAMEDIPAPKDYHAQPTLPTDGEMAEEQQQMAQAETDSIDEEIATQNQIIQALQDTQRALIQNDAVAALASCVVAAELGNVDAQKMAAGMYEAGRGTEANADKALHWYLQAAQQEDTEAQKKVAEFYFNGTGVPEDKAEALVWYKKVAEKGDATAQFNVGAMYSGGLGTAADKAEAFRWFLLAAQQGHSSAQHNVANLYRTGQGTAVNMDECFRWYLQAAEQGIAASQFNVGSLYLGGVGTEADEAQALYWFRKAAEQGHVQAVEMVQQLEAPAEPEQEVVEAAETGVADEVDSVSVDAEPQIVAEEPGEAEVSADNEETDEEEAEFEEWLANGPTDEIVAVAADYYEEEDYESAFELFLHAAQRGNEDGQYMTAAMYMSGEGTKQDQAEAFRWYLKAAEQGNAAAQYQVGQMQYQSCGRFSDEKGIYKAFDWFMKAAKQGHRKAQMQVGNMYLRDQTAEAAQQALYWFRKAAEQGHAQAAEMVRQLKAQSVKESTTEPEVMEETEPDWNCQ